ncbi:TetR/AcrR family transcriptional regulator [Streptomyces sp. NPDC002680]|uniref:TetR/AcrR family transcriptional regulator n=1 Tax=Streptomyces sp. NPDC002680 TaxID=3364659 RepID=UPI003686F553
MVTPPSSIREQIIRTAERLFAERGVDGVSLRQIGVEAGNGNNSAVQYHFGSKARLVQAIFEYRLPYLHQRRRTLVALRRPADLRSWVECYVLPVLELGEHGAGRYLGFVAMLQRHGHLSFPEMLRRPDQQDVADGMDEEHLESAQQFRERMGLYMTHVPEPLRTHRIAQSMTFGVHAGAERELVRAGGGDVLPFAVHVVDLIDGLTAFLGAPVSTAALAALEGADFGGSAWPLVP